jgi:hypothetical protein
MNSNAGMLPLAGERGLRASIRRLVTAVRRLPCSGSRKRVLWNSEAWPAQPARGGEEQRGRALLHCSTTTASSRFGFMECQSAVTVWHLAQTGSPLLPRRRKGKPHSRWRRKCRSLASPWRARCACRTRTIHPESRPKQIRQLLGRQFCGIERSPRSAFAGAIHGSRYYFTGARISSRRSGVDSTLSRCG